MNDSSPIGRTTARPYPALDEPLPPVRPARRIRRWMVVLLILGLAGALAHRLHQDRQARQAATAQTAQVDDGGSGRKGAVAQAVGIALVSTGDMPIVLQGLGTVTPLATVSVRSQISGYLMEIGYREGQMVKRGDFLAQIDPRPYEALLAQYQGQLARDQALLQNSRLDLIRYQTLNRQDSIAKQNVDTQASLVKQNEGTVAADQAMVDQQRLNIAYTRITSPVEGRVGLRQVDAGNYVSAGSTALVVVTQLKPISVLFTLPEDDVARVMKQVRAGAKLSVRAYDRGDQHEIATGRLETVDNQIDVTTGTVKLRAIFENADEALFPNQFVNARLTVDTIRNAPIVPSAAILRGSPGTYVYLMQGDDKVTVRPITLGQSDGPRTVVLAGLKPGERVVVDGTDRLREGASVRVTAEAPGMQAKRDGETGASAAPGAERATGSIPEPAAKPPEAKAASAEPPSEDGRRRARERKAGQ